VPAGFNLLDFFDAPAAFGCQLTVEGAALWQGEPFAGGPKIGLQRGTGAVPVWFAPADVIHLAIQDGVLTIGELAGLEGLLVGHATQFNETHHPHPLPPELGGGGHPSPKQIMNARGWLQDGRRFSFHLTSVMDEVQVIQISFR
jgi:hypothetical protein